MLLIFYLHHHRILFIIALPDELSGRIQLFKSAVVVVPVSQLLHDKRPDGMLDVLDFIGQAVASHLDVVVPLFLLLDLLL